MGFLDKLRGELVDIIEWLDPTTDTLVYRFPRYANEIKYGAQLVVRQAQVAVFVDQGRIADIFESGMYTLETQNLPILSTLRGWKYGFHSPFKAEVYFVSTRRITDRKWGTMNPIMLRDAEFGPIRLRAFGTYAIRAADARKLITEVVGTDGHFSAGDITDQIRNYIITQFSDLIGESKIPALELAANYEELSKKLLESVNQRVEPYGLELTTLLVENVSLPPEVEKALDKRSSMGVIGDMNQYARYTSAEAIRDAANNPAGGLAGAGAGLGAGMSIARQMTDALQPGGGAGQGQPQAAAVPPPLPPSGPQFHVARDGQSIGPLDLKQLAIEVQSRRITGETLVWSTGMAAWTPAGQVAALAELLKQLPPPLPPQGQQP